MTEDDEVTTDVDCRLEKQQQCSFQHMRPIWTSSLVNTSMTLMQCIVCCCLCKWHVED